MACKLEKSIEEAINKLNEYRSKFGKNDSELASKYVRAIDRKIDRLKKLQIHNDKLNMARELVSGDKVKNAKATIKPPKPVISAATEEKPLSTQVESVSSSSSNSILKETKDC